jgi:hypothetical protein
MTRFIFGIAACLLVQAVGVDNIMSALQAAQNAARKAYATAQKVVDAAKEEEGK